MKPAISIIVPIYKVEPYIRRCIDSILAQEFKNFELILVDDGSLDNCGKICDEYAQTDKRVKVIHKKNGGQSSARNAGLDVAQGNYVGFVDGDDFINGKMYKILYENICKYSSDLVVCDFLKVMEGTPVVIKDNILKNEVTQFTNKEALEQLFVYQDGIYVSGSGPSVKWITAWNKLYKRQLFENLRFPEGRIFEDEYITHRILYRCKNITLCAAKLYYYVQRQNSTLNSSYSIKKWDRVYALKDRVDFLKSVDNDQLYEKALVCYTDAFFWCYFKSKTLLKKEDYDFRKLKRMLSKKVPAILRSQYIMRRQKIMICIFTLNPFIYNLYLKIKGTANAGANT